MAQKVGLHRKIFWYPCFHLFEKNSGFQGYVVFITNLYLLVYNKWFMIHFNL